MCRASKPPIQMRIVCVMGLTEWLMCANYNNATCISANDSCICLAHELKFISFSTQLCIWWHVNTHADIKNPDHLIENNTRHDSTVEHIFKIAILNATYAVWIKFIRFMTHSFFAEICIFLTRKVQESLYFFLKLRQIFSHQNYVHEFKTV